MDENSRIARFQQPGTIVDPLTEMAREGARQMLMAALKAEATNFVEQFDEERLADGRRRVVRHGSGPERMIQTGIGPISVQRQKVRDRAAGLVTGEKSGSLRLFCRNGRGGRRAWMRCCRSFICAVSPPAIFRRLLPPCLARTHRTFRPRSSPV